MHSFKKFGTLAVAVFALSAIGAASAPAATFTASETGSLTGAATEEHVITTNGGTINCQIAATSGTIASTAATAQHVTVHYTQCTAFGIASVQVSPGTYEFTAGTGKNFHIKNTITVTAELFGKPLCTVTFKPQTVGTFDYTNASSSTIKFNPTVTGITYTSSGGSCGASGSNGTYTGASVFSRVGGGTLQYDA
jgi:hypothetical protein